MKAPYTVARRKEECACHHSVPSCPGTLNRYVYEPLGWMGHCDTRLGPSAQGVMSWSTPCLSISKAPAGGSVINKSKKKAGSVIRPALPQVVPILSKCTELNRP